MVYIVITVVSIIVFIISVIIIKRKQGEKNKYYDAAYKKLKEKYLTNSLTKDKIGENTGIASMIYLKLCNSKPKQGYVFDPREGISFGRDKNMNSIFLPYPTVSMQHCRIVMHDGYLYLQDLNSSNGTILKSGLSKTLVSDGNSVLINSGDKIIIAGLIFKVIIFDFNMS